MALNSIETASRYTGELDRMFVQKAVTGFLTDNAFGARFVGAKTVLLPDLDFAGLADYDRDDGFVRGKTTVSQTSYTLAMDRGRTLQLDRMDMDETGISGLAGKVLSEFVRQKVVPECDAYILSKLYGVANTRSHTKTYAAASAVADLLDAINSVYDATGYDSELVAFVNPALWSALMTSPELSREIVISDFKQGEADLQVKRLNGAAILPVTSGRMKTEFTFEDGEAENDGGFTAAGGAKDIYALILPRDGASVVRKTEKLRIFEPDQNPDADAYKFDYRIHYDAFVRKSKQDSIYAIVGE